jgi:hypothetical protein
MVEREPRQNIQPLMCNTFISYLCESYLVEKGTAIRSLKSSRLKTKALIL